MKYVVCTKYCGAVVELSLFETLQEAEDFMQKPCVLLHKDEIEDGTEDEIVQPYEMWIEQTLNEDLPFCEPPLNPIFDYVLDDMPF